MTNRLLPTLTGAAMLAATLVGATAFAAEKLPVRFTLDWKIQGVHAPFYLAQQRGYFADNGLDVTIDQGEGSAATVSRVLSGTYDAGFGDMNAIIQTAAKTPDTAPVMVYQIYNQPPFAVLTKADSPIQSVADFPGHTFGGPAGSAATKLFPAMLDASDINADSVHITNVAPQLQEQLLNRGDVDASLVFNVTSYMNLVSQGKDPDADYRWFAYGDNGLNIYSNGVMVSQAMIADHPGAVEGLVTAINHAMQAIIADPQAGIDAVKAREAFIDASAERKRLDFAMTRLIVSDESRAIGIGDVDKQRLSKSIDTIVDLYDLERTPSADQVFTDRFLPPRDQRLP
ncbi:ABC transporter substrate-binding protein [Salinisphaera sp. C84B14]|uniref:ABC transporter substrate-binding protein n=1 Tax=Salinisphaera sp. C84B14 TaxID=1304155 RepID=UPI00334065D9